MSEGLERVTFAATVDETGKIHPERVNVVRGKLVRFTPKKDRKVLVTVSRYVKPKSNEQLALYRGPVLRAWSEHTGYELDEMHTELKRAYLVPQLVVARLTGEEMKELPSLADLNVEEMSAYLSRVIKEGRLLGIEFDLDQSS